MSELRKHSLPSLNQAQIDGCVSYVCKVERGLKECNQKFPTRKKIRRHLREAHGIRDEAPLRKYYKVVP